jgi:hypothetical protein
MKQYQLPEQIMERANSYLKQAGLPVLETPEKLFKFLREKGWIDQHDEPTEEGNQLDMLKGGPVADSN